MGGLAQAVALPQSVGVLGAPVNVPAASTTAALTTAALTPGVWWVAVSLDVVFSGGTATLIEAQMVAGTAVATFAGGPTSDGLQMGNAAGGVAQGEVNLEAIVTVTTTGTLVVNVKNPSGTTAATVAASSGSFAGSSGYIAVKVA